MSEELTGTIVPLVTPFDKEEKFDVGGMTGLIDYIIDQGADGIMATALTGEGPLLSPDELPGNLWKPCMCWGILSLARRIYYDQILPVVDMLAKNNNPTGTITAGVAARGVEVGIPRRSGSGVNAVDQERLAALVRRIEQLE